MSSFSLPISPIRPQIEEDHTDEEKTEPFVDLNNSVASNSSSEAGDEIAQPSSSAAGLLDERDYKDNPINRVNMTAADGKPIVLSELDRRFRAQHYYNNPLDEYTFLTENFIPFMGMVMVSNILYWLHQLGEGFETTRWFALWGWKRIFLEALQQTLCRLPYPRIYNCSNHLDWLRDLHSQSSNIALVTYPWAETPLLSQFASTTYKPITEHYCFNHRHKDLQGFIIGVQDQTPGNSPGYWQWKYRFYCQLPDKMLAFVQARLPDFNFGGSSVVVSGPFDHGGTTFNNNYGGFWSVCYDRLYFTDTEDPHRTFSDDVPCPREVHSGVGFSTLDQTALLPPYLTTGQSPIPTEHLQPGVYPSLNPYQFHPGYYLPRSLSNPSDPLTYNLMPTNIRTQLSTLTDKVEGLTMTLQMTEHEVRMAQEDISKLRLALKDTLDHGIKDRVHYMESWFDDYKKTIANLRDDLTASELKVTALERALEDSKDKVKSFLLNFKD